MSEDDDLERQRASAAAEAERRYEETRGLLLRLFTRKLGVAPDDAEKLVYETFLDYQWLSGPRPYDASEWLIRTACSRAMKFLGLEPDAAGDAARRFEETLRFEEALETLPARARKALWLSMEKKMSHEEIAAELGISTFAARHSVHTAAAKLRKRLRGR